jgi:signal transduction histidine kinase
MMMKAGAGLRLKFFLSISLLIVLTSVSLGWFFSRHGVELITLALVERGKSLVVNLASNLGYELQFATEQRLRELIEGVIRQEDVLYVVIQDAEGEIRAQAHAGQPEEIPPLSLARSPMEGIRWADPSTRAFVVTWRGERIYELVHPVKTQGKREREEIGLTVGGQEQTIGWATVGMSLSLRRVDETIVQVRWTTALLTLVVVVFGIVVTALLARVIVGPINKLAAATKRIAQGEAPFHVAVDSRDEIGELAASFNRMTEAVRRRERDNVALVRALEETNLKLEAANRHKSEFLANVSHELRTPLTAIKGAVDLLLRELVGPLTDRQQRHLTRVRSNAQHLAGLINDLLDLSMVEAGRLELRATRLLLETLVHEVVDALRPMAAEKRVALEILRAEPPPVVRADPARVTQVLMNLIGNAIKFTPSLGTVTVSVARAGDQWAQVSVRDTGPGIPADETQRIFDKFYQIAEAGKQRPGGTGLGLAIARALVELHGSKIWVESEVGRGSAFFFTLPLDEPRLGAAEHRLG